MIGIYKIENLITHRVYIGQSVNIGQRWTVHRSSAFNPNAHDYNSQLYRSIRKHGLHNFSFEVLHEVSPQEYSVELLNQLERKYIAQYNSFVDGYNATPGGEYGISQKGELNGRALVTEDDVRLIREMYAAHIPHREVYELFKNRLTDRGFTKIWTGETWRHISMDVYSVENRLFHKTLSKKLPRNMVHNAKLSEQDVTHIQELKKRGKGVKEVYQQYRNLISFSGFENVWYI